MVSDADATEAQRELLATLQRPDGQALNIFRVLANHPDLTRRWLVFGNHILGKSTLDARTRELVILRTGWLSGSDYEFGQHVLIAREAGVSDDDIYRTRTGPDDAGWSDADRAALRAADELHADQQITDPSWAALTAHFDTQQCMDLVFTVGQYVLVSMALNAFGVPRDAGVPGFDPEPT